MILIPAASRHVRVKKDGGVTSFVLARHAQDLFCIWAPFKARARLSGYQPSDPAGSAGPFSLFSRETCGSERWGLL